MLTINYDRIDGFVAKQKLLGNDVRFDNYDVVFFRAVENAVYSKHGVWRDQWGYENRFSPNGFGNWEIDRRNVRRAKRVNT